ncbi:hypothetical protein PR048_029800 [Dryococelus australis]|uniref:Uncharacterized protein n=1 Tax=Dryococelus australis TaxID=614101 RepID=A0ABQ9G755_9NEOP|nr:hypothetical protein PR048_029800 [Dryococelus australis]
MSRLPATGTASRCVKAVHDQVSTLEITAYSSKYSLFCGGHGGPVVSSLSSNQGDPASIPGRATPDFRTWDSCLTMPFVGGSSRGSPVSPATSFRRCSILTSVALIGSQELAVKSCPNIVDAVRREHFMSVQCLALSGDGALDARGNVALMPPPPPSSFNNLAASSARKQLQERGMDPASIQLWPNHKWNTRADALEFSSIPDKLHGPLNNGVSSHQLNLHTVLILGICLFCDTAHLEVSGWAKDPACSYWRERGGNEIRHRAQRGVIHSDGRSSWLTEAAARCRMRRHNTLVKVVDSFLWWVKLEYARAAGAEVGVVARSLASRGEPGLTSSGTTLGFMHLGIGRDVDVDARGATLTVILRESNAHAENLCSIINRLFIPNSLVHSAPRFTLSTDDSQQRSQCTHGRGYRETDANMKRPWRVACRIRTDRPSCLELIPALEAEKRGSYKDKTATRCKCAIASTRRTLLCSRSAALSIKKIVKMHTKKQAHHILGHVKDRPYTGTTEAAKMRTEQCRKARPGKTEDPRENPPTSGIVRHVSHGRQSMCVRETTPVLNPVLFGA